MVEMSSNIERTASCTISLVRIWDTTVQGTNTYLELPAVTVNVSSDRLWIRLRHAINFGKARLHSQAHASLHSKSVRTAMKRTMYDDDSGSNPGLRILLLSCCNIDNSSRGKNMHRVSRKQSDKEVDAPCQADHGSTTGTIAYSRGKMNLQPVNQMRGIPSQCKLPCPRPSQSSFTVTWGFRLRGYCRTVGRRHSIHGSNHRIDADGT